MKKRMLPGRGAHVLAMICTFVLTCVMVLGCVVWQVSRVAHDSALHQTIAADERVLAAQRSRIETTVKDLAGRYFFMPETVLDLITDDALRQHSLDAAAWWVGLLGENPVLEAPSWDTRDIEQAVREDVLFQENTPSSLRRATARDDVAYEVGRAVDRAVMPVRTELMTLLLPKVLEKVDVPRYVGYLSMAPAVCGGAALALCLLLALLMRRRLSKALMYMGAGFAACALVMLCLGVMTYGIGITAMVAEVSAILGMQVSLLTKQIALQVGVFAACCAVLGLALIGVHQADMKRLLCRQGSAAA